MSLMQQNTTYSLIGDGNYGPSKSIYSILFLTDIPMNPNRPEESSQMVDGIGIFDSVKANASVRWEASVEEKPSHIVVSSF